ncbi:MAG: hypothetical protein IT192_03810 [Microbacteriaceae bacterium]|nr:hypothetical protein [Microbacteriaceae bacterium]
MIELHLRGKVAAGGQVDLEAFLTEASPFYEAPGGIRVRLLWSTTEEGRFIELIEYADQQTYDLDQERVESDPTMKAYLERWRSLLAEPPVVEIYRT